MRIVLLMQVAVFGCSVYFRQAEQNHTDDCASLRCPLRPMQGCFAVFWDIDGGFRFALPTLREPQEAM